MSVCFPTLNHAVLGNEDSLFFMDMTWDLNLKTQSSADPEGGQGVHTPPRKSQVKWVYIGNKQLEPPPWKKLDPPTPWKMLDPLWNLEK